MKVLLTILLANLVASGCNKEDKPERVKKETKEMHEEDNLTTETFWVDLSDFEND